MRRRLAFLVGVVVATATSARTSAAARPRFEPTDLELETEGILDVDVQSGFTMGPPIAADGTPARDASGGPPRVFPRRWIVADVEAEVGLAPNVELDVDGAVYIENDRTWSTDPLWVSAKLGLVDVRAADGARTAALGLQLGPRLPFVHAGHGVGYAALFLFGLGAGSFHAVFNLGGSLDPGDAISRGRPTAALVGASTTLPLTRTMSWLFQAGAALYLGGQSNDVVVGTGLGWAADERLDVSMVALGGSQTGGDRGVVLVGVSPKTRLW